MIDALGEVVSGAVRGVAKAAAPAVAETATSGIAKIASETAIQGAEVVIGSVAPEISAVGSAAARSLGGVMEQTLASVGPDSALKKLLEAKSEGTLGQGLSNEPAPISESNTITPEGLQSNNTASPLSSEPVVAGSTFEPSNLTGQEPIASEGGTKAETAEGEVSDEGKVPAGETPQEAITLEQYLSELTLEQRIERIKELLDGEQKRGERTEEILKSLQEQSKKLQEEQAAQKRREEELMTQNQSLMEEVRTLREQQAKLASALVVIDEANKLKIVNLSDYIARRERTVEEAIAQNRQQQQKAA